MHYKFFSKVPSAIRAGLRRSIISVESTCVRGQASGYHIDCLLSEHGRTSLSNEKQHNNLFRYGCSLYSAAKTKSGGDLFPRFGFYGSSFSSAACSSEDSTASDVLLDNSESQEKHSNSSDSELNSPTSTNLKLNSAACSLAHPDKMGKCGEDAHFICNDKQVIGVADGVGGWAVHGVDAGIYARELMANAVDAIKEEPMGCIDPLRVLEKAYANTKAKGSSTACIIALTDQGLQAINLGDSGFMVVRGGCTIFKSRPQHHNFNFTYQLEHGNTTTADLPSAGQVFKVPVVPGDVIVAGTDGLFDNLYNNDITAIVVHGLRAGFGPKITAQKIAALARQRSQDKNRHTPFATAAQEAGVRHYGGKPDDITVVVSLITSDHKENASPSNGSS